MEKMISKKLRIAVFFLFGIIIYNTTGCSSIGPELGLFGGNRVNPSGANQLFDEKFEEIDLVKLLDPDNKAKEEYERVENGKTKEPEKWEKLPDEDKLGMAFHAFYHRDYGDEDTLKRRRNQIQERILAASNQRCNLYKTYLKNVNARTNFLLGATTTLLGGAGAIVTGATAARILAGSAGITSGVRAEFDQAYFSMLAVNVITAGIDKEREEQYNKIIERRKDASIEAYPVEAAVKDAILYHGACSMTSGLEKANNVLQMDYKLGLKIATDAVVQAKEFGKEIRKTERDDKFGVPIFYDIDKSTIPKIISDIKQKQKRFLDKDIKSYIGKIEEILKQIYPDSKKLDDALKAGLTTLKDTLGGADLKGHITDTIKEVEACFRPLEGKISTARTEIGKAKGAILSMDSADPGTIEQQKNLLDQNAILKRAKGEVDAIQGDFNNKFKDIKDNLEKHMRELFAATAINSLNNEKAINALSEVNVAITDIPAKLKDFCEPIEGGDKTPTPTPTPTEDGDKTPTPTPTPTESSD